MTIFGSRSLCRGGCVLNYGIAVGAERCASLPFIGAGLAIATKQGASDHRPAAASEHAAREIIGYLAVAVG